MLHMREFAECDQCVERWLKSIERVSDAISNALDKRSSFFASELVRSPYFPHVWYPQQPVIRSLKKKSEIRYRRYIHDLHLDFLIHHLFDLLLLRPKIMAQPVQRVTSDNQRCCHGRLAHCDESLSTDLLALCVVGLQNIVFALNSLAEREQSNTSRIIVELAGRLLDNRELGIDFR
jgi:hypothetical protein